MVNIRAAQSVTKATPEGDAITSPAEVLQQKLEGQRVDAGPSETLNSIIESSSRASSEAVIDPEEILGEEQPTQDNVAKTLRMEVDEQAAENPNEFMQTMMRSDANLYARGKAAQLEEEAGRNTRRYNFKSKKPAMTVDGGIFQRADDFANNLLNPETLVGVSGLLHPKFAVDPDTPAINTSSKANMGKLIQKVGGVTTDPRTGQLLGNPEFFRVASLVAEDVIADQTMGESRIQSQKEKKASKKFGEDFDPFEDMRGEEFRSDLSNSSYLITKAQRNKELGSRILKEWNLISNNDMSQVTDQDKEFLGDAIKELYYEVNKGPEGSRNMIRRELQNGQVVFEVTSHGQSVFKQSENIRKLYFPKQHKDALEKPRSDRSREKIRYSGDKKLPLHSDDLIAAVKNLESIPNLVIPRREKILLATLLSALSENNASPEVIEMAKAINGFGADKEAQFMATAKLAQLRNEEPFDIQENLDLLKRSIAQSLYGIAKHRNKEFYLTYFIQAFNGRITPEQTHMNPTVSKQARFVTGSPHPALLIPGNNSRIEQNLKEMYSMMIVKLEGKGKAGPMLRKQRLEMFEEAYPKLIEAGRVLKEALDNTNIDSDKISEAILKGVPLDNVNFPEFQGLNLDPSNGYHKMLIDRIAEKGEDGLSLIDGLIDIYEYDQVLQYNKDNPNSPRQFGTYYNAYIDGKTNGLASNAMQLGIESTGYRTGVFRKEGSNYAVDGDKDLRDALADSLVEALRSEGFRNNLTETVGNNATPLTKVAFALFTNRSLNKTTTMTFGYGKSMTSFRNDLVNFLVLNREESIRSVETLKGKPQDLLTEKEKDLIELNSFYEILENSKPYMDGGPDWATSVEEVIAADLFDLYADKLIEVITPVGIKARQLMYNIAMAHVVMDEILELDGPVGMPLYYGGVETYSTPDTPTTSYSVYSDDPSVRGGKRDVKTIHYELKPTAAAIRGTGDRGYIGGAALGGALPGPVQALDAATVALTATGSSFEKLKQASQGYPYMHTIYDAFKTDAMGFDVIVNETNQNWLDANFAWNYLEQARDSLKKAGERFNNNLQKLDPSIPVDIGIKSGYRKIGNLLSVQEVRDPSFPDAPPKKKRTSLTSFVKRNMPIGTTDSEVYAQVDMFINKLINAGVLSNRYDNPTELKPAQIKKFIMVFGDFFNLKGGKEGLDSFIQNEVNPARKALKSKVISEQKAGRMVRQFHDH